MMDINNKKVALYGFGLSNNAFIEFILKNKFNTLVYCFDDKKQLDSSLIKENIIFKHYEKWDFAELDYIISSPGISLEFPQEHYILKKAKEFNIPIVCDIEIFFKVFKVNKSIAVTGTNGKSTTVSLINYVLNSLSFPSYLAGNIGKAIFKNHENYKSDNTCVLELSSFQLSLMEDASFNVAVLLNISHDHINYHGSLENYIKAKTRIFSHNNKKSSSLVISVDDEYSNKLAEQACKSGFNVLCFSLKNKVFNGACIVNNTLQEYKEGNLVYSATLPNFYIKGQHNLQNVLASYLAIKAYKADIKSELLLNVIAKFKGIEHRQELFASYKNIDFINDSKATNIHASSKALDTFNNIVLLLGGNYKGDDVAILKECLPKVYKIHLFGNETVNKLYSLLQENFKNLNIVRHNSISNAIFNAFEDAIKLEKQLNEKVNVLLSPGCSSYDAFNNFEERGVYFKNEVNKLISKKQK